MALKAKLPNALLLFALLLLVLPTQQKRFYSVMGPFQAILRRATACPSEMLAKEHVTHTIRDVRTNRRQLPTYSGEITSPLFLNDSFNGRLALAVWSNMGGWKDNAHVFNFKTICTTLDSFAHGVWSDIQSCLFGELVGCPLYPGNYVYDNCTIDVTTSQKQVPIKYFLYGRWRGDAMVLDKTGGVVACVRGFVDTVPM